MNWQTVREHYPKQWLLIEAIKARSEGGKRILEQISVIHVCSDSRTAMNEYKKLKKEAPAREMFVLHTSNPEIEITERQWFGIRGYNGDALAAQHGLLWVSASLLYSGKQLLCKNVLVDTGSTSTIFRLTGFLLPVCNQNQRMLYVNSEAWGDRICVCQTD